MRYLCLVYFEPEALSALSPDEKTKLDRDSLAYDEELNRTGNYIVANALDRTATARRFGSVVAKCRPPMDRSRKPRRF